MAVDLLEEKEVIDIIRKVAKVFDRDDVSNHDVRAILISMLAMIYGDELKHFPNCRDSIRVRFEKEIEVLRQHAFGDR